jgi:hypothetical protein
MSRGLFAGLIVMGMMWTPAWATTVKTFVFEEMCETAQTIVHVKCLTRDNAVFADREGIFTQTRFKVMAVVKGQTNSEMVLTLPGGKWEGQQMSVPGMPKFVVGEETVLFLSKRDNYGSPWPMGLGQGCYAVQVGKGGSRQVRLRHVPLPPGVRSKPEQAKESHMALDDFLTAVREVLNVNEREEPVEK